MSQIKDVKAKFMNANLSPSKFEQTPHAKKSLLSSFCGKGAVPSTSKMSTGNVGVKTEKGKTEESSFPDSGDDHMLEQEMLNMQTDDGNPKYDNMGKADVEGEESAMKKTKID